MEKRNAPSRSQGRDEMMLTASFVAFLAPVVKRLFAALAVHELAAAAVVVSATDLLRQGVA